MIKQYIFYNIILKKYLNKFTKENKGDPISANINIVRITPKRYSIRFSSSIVVYPHNIPVNKVYFVTIENNGLYINENVMLLKKYIIISTLDKCKKVTYLPNRVYKSKTLKNK